MKNNSVSTVGSTFMLTVFLAIGTLINSLPAEAGTIIPVKILFDGNCPVEAVPTSIDMSKAGQDKVQWAAYDRSTGQPIQMGYQIFFDPFKGKSLTAGNNGVATSQPVARDVPVNVNFKYTVYNPECPTQPLDPMIRIR